MGCERHTHTHIEALLHNVTRPSELKVDLVTAHLIGKVVNVLVLLRGQMSCGGIFFVFTVFLKNTYTGSEGNFINQCLY